MINIVRTISELPDNIHSIVDEANVFYSDEYREYEKGIGSNVIYAYTNNMIQVVTLHTIKGLFHTATFPSEPFYFGEISESSVQQMLDQLLVILKKEFDVDWTTVTPASSLFTAYPTNSMRIPFGNYIIDLTYSEEQLFQNVTSKHRNMIRRGMKSEIYIKYGSTNLLDDYLELDRQTWQRSGQDIDHSAYYKKYLEYFKEHAIVGVAYKDSIPQCGLIGLYNNRMFYYMFGASANKPEPGSTHYLQWNTILKMKEIGVKQYSFVGCRINVDEDSKLYNIQHFKKGFGGKLIDCYMFKSILNSQKKKMFDRLMKIRTGKVAIDVIDEEIHKWHEMNF